MPFLKRKDVKSEEQKKTGAKKQVKNEKKPVKNKTSDEGLVNQKPIKKKKIRIGFGFRKKETPEKETQKKLEETPLEEKIEEKLQDVFPVEEETPLRVEAVEKKQFTPQKKPIIKKDMKGKPVFLEDTGEKLGAVFDTIYDKDNNVIGYKVKDVTSDAVISFPADQFDYNKDGLIFVPGWYTNALKIIEKLEFKDKISPELTALLTEDSVSNEELYKIFVKHDDEMAKYIDDAKTLREMLANRLKVLEKQRVSLKDNLMDLTEKRLIKDIDRRQFSEDVLEHRRKVNILDVNINKCKDLINRLDKTSFGALGKNNFTYKSADVKIENNLYEKILDRNARDNNRELHDQYKEDTLEESYKEKYLALKEEFEQLEDDYKELKIAVDKLFNKNEI